MAEDYSPQYLDPENNPAAIVFPESSTFGGKSDYESGQDDGKFMGGKQGMSYDPSTGWENPEPYIALNPHLVKTLGIQPGQQIPVINPHTGAQTIAIFRDFGPAESLQHRLDMSPMVANSIGLKPGQPAALDFLPVMQGKLGVVPPNQPGGQGQQQASPQIESPDINSMIDMRNQGAGYEQNFINDPFGQGQPPSREDIQQALATQPPESNIAAAQMSGDQAMQAFQSAMQAGQVGSPTSANVPQGLRLDVPSGQNLVGAGQGRYQVTNVNPDTGIVTYKDGTTLNPSTGLLSTPVDGGGRAIFFPGQAQPHYVMPSSQWQIVSDTNSGEHYRVNKDTGESQRIDLGMAPSAIPEGVTGVDALQYIPASDRGIVKKIATYDMAPPTGFALKSPAWKRVMEGVTAYNPNYDATNYAPKMATKQSFKAGKYSQAITSLNVAIQHLSELDNAARALNNTNWPMYNSLANYLSAATGHKQVTNFNKAATAVQNEMATVFKGTSGTDQEIKEWRNTLNSSQSPEQLADGINEALRLMRGRLDALHSTYVEGIGMPSDIKFIRGKSPEILQKHFGQWGQDMIDSDASSSSGIPSSSPEPSSATYTNSQGTQFIPNHTYIDPASNTAKIYIGGDPKDPNNWKYQ